MHQFHLRWVQNWLVMNTPDALARPANPSPDEFNLQKRGNRRRKLPVNNQRQQLRVVWTILWLVLLRAYNTIQYLLFNVVNVLS